MKRPYLLIVCLGVSLVLTGCNGTTNPTAPDGLDPRMLQRASLKAADDIANSDIVTAPFRSYVLVAIGDSITEGVGSSRGTAGYPGMLEDRLHTAGYLVEVYNEGASGTNAGTADRSFLANVRGADITLIMIGSNDISSPGQCEIPYYCQTIDHIRSMIVKAVNNGIVPVLATVTPKNPSDIYAHYNLQIEALNQQIFSLGTEYRIKVVDTYTAIMNNGRSVLFSDKHHFNDLGYNVIAEAYYQTLSELIFKPQPPPQPAEN